MLEIRGEQTRNETATHKVMKKKKDMQVEKVSYNTRVGAWETRTNVWQYLLGHL